MNMSLIPAVADAVAQHNAPKADRIVSSAFRLVALLALPAGVGLSVLAQPILLLLYPAQRTDAIAAGPHLQVLGIASIFVCLMLLTNAILQSYGKQMVPIYTMSAAPRPAQPRSFSRGFQQPLQSTGDMSFEDKLKLFMSSSEGKMADLNRNIDGKRGGRRRK